MALTAQSDEEWMAVQCFLADFRKGQREPSNYSTARTLAVELAKQIEQQAEECEYPHVPTDRLESLIEEFLVAHRITP